MRAGEYSCRDVVQGYLDRIETYDRASGINAVTVINANALARADDIDAALTCKPARKCGTCGEPEPTAGHHPAPRTVYEIRDHRRAVSVSIHVQPR